MKNKEGFGHKFGLAQTLYFKLQSVYHTEVCD